MNASAAAEPQVDAAFERKRVVFLVRAPKKPYAKDYEAVADKLRAEFAAAGWTVRNIRPRSSGPRPEVGSRPVCVLEPVDAHAIYVEAHRSSVAVVQVAASGVLKKPDTLATPRNTMTLETFVRYKACFIVASPEVSSVDAVKVAQAWGRQTACSSDEDPRCIPLHMFSPDNDWVGLATSTATFDAAHGKANSRMDSERRRWPKDLSEHGRQVDVVAGHSMRRGYHWDVQALRNKSYISNAEEVWAIEEDGHLNAYPDSFVRAGTKSRLKFRATRPSEVLDASVAGSASAAGTGKPKQRKRRRRR